MHTLFQQQNLFTIINTDNFSETKSRTVSVGDLLKLKNVPFKKKEEDTIQGNFQQQL